MADVYILVEINVMSSPDYLYPEKRMEPLIWLSHQTGEPMAGEEYLAYLAAEAEAQAISLRCGILPTIGCEVEVSVASRFPELTLEYLGGRNEDGRFERPFRQLDKEKQEELRARAEAEGDRLWGPLYSTSEAAGIPQGDDGYWEFANNPVHNWRTLSKEVGLLMVANLIPEGEQNAMHVTLAGVDHDQNSARKLLAAVELATTTRRRILSGFSNLYTDGAAWAQKGMDGVLWRHEVTVDLVGEGGVEFRSLVAVSPEQVERVLFTTQMLGAVLVSAQTEGWSDSSAMTNELAGLWPRLDSSMSNLMIERGLEPDGGWGIPVSHPEPWIKWAECIARRDDKESAEYATVVEISDIADEAAEIIDQESDIENLLGAAVSRQKLVTLTD